jgi:hypothetical protein
MASLMKDNLSFCPELAEVIGAGEANGRSSTAQNVFGLSTVNNLVILRNLFTEIMAKRHTAIDPFQTDWNDMALVTLDNAGLRGYLDFRPEFSSVALPTLVREGARFELIFIDGSHFFDDVFVDVYFTTQLLVDGGIVAFDDSTNRHVRKVLRFIRANCG